MKLISIYIFLFTFFGFSFGQKTYRMDFSIYDSKNKLICDSRKSPSIDKEYDLWSYAINDTVYSCNIRDTYYNDKCQIKSPNRIKSLFSQYSQQRLILIKNKQDTMVIDIFLLGPFLELITTIDSIIFHPGYYILDLRKYADVHKNDSIFPRYPNFKNSLFNNTSWIKKLFNNTSWIKKYELNDYKTFFSFCN